MEIILAILCAIAVGVIAGYLFGKRGVAQAEQRAAALQEQILTLSQLKAALDKEVTMLKEQLDEQSRRAAAELAQLKEEHQARLAEQEARFKEADAARRAEFKQQNNLTARVLAKLCAHTVSNLSSYVSRILRTEPPYMAKSNDLSRPVVA